MDALLITDVSAETALILFAIVGLLLACVLAGVLIAFGWVLKCTVERMVKSSMSQSKTNHDAICEQGGAVKGLQEAVARIERALPKRRVR